MNGQTVIINIAIRFIQNDSNIDLSIGLCVGLSIELNIELNIGLNIGLNILCSKYFNEVCSGFVSTDGRVERGRGFRFLDVSSCDIGILLSTLRGYGRNQHTAGGVLKPQVKVGELRVGQA